MLKQRRGFTAVELGVVALALVILSGAALFGTSSFIESGRRSDAAGAAAGIGTAISRYHYEVGVYPANLAALTGTSGVYGPWLAKLDNDPWGNAWNYVYTNRGFAVWSLGKNGVNDSGGGGGTLPAAFAGDDIGQIGQ